MAKEMTLDDALTILSPDTPKPDLMSTAARTTGSIPAAYTEAIQVALECIKRCRDFEDLRDDPDRTPFENQCDRISNRLDKLSDWEAMFYLCCLMPRLDAKMKGYLDAANKEDGKNGDALRLLLLNDIAVLRSVRESLVHDLF